MVSASQETPSQERKERLHTRRGHISDAYSISDTEYERHTFHPTAKTKPDTRILDWQVVLYYDGKRGYPDEEYFSSNHIQYVKEVYYDFFHRSELSRSLSKVSVEFYFLINGLKALNYNRAKTAKTLSILTAPDLRWAGKIYDDLEQMTFMLYRAALGRYKPIRGGPTIKPFFNYLNTLVFSYLGNYLWKNSVELVAATYSNLEAVSQNLVCYDDFSECFTPLHEIVGWPVTYYTIAKFCNIHPKAARNIFSRVKSQHRLVNLGFFDAVKEEADYE